MSPERVDVLGVGVDAVSEEEVVEVAARAVASDDSARIVTVNAEYVMLARKQPEFASVIQRAALATPDGVGVVWAMRLKGAMQRRRVGGSDLIWSLSRMAAERGYRVYLLGAGEGVAAAAGERLCRAVPGLLLAGTHAGSPSALEAGEIAERIRQARADILFVAYGAPAQDLWIDRHLAASGARVGIGVGGTLDYVAGRARRAPVWMRESGLDWLWRLIREPWRWRRMAALPQFAWLVLYGAIGKGNGS